MISDDILDVTEEFIRFNPLFYTAWMLGTPSIVNDPQIPTAAVSFNEEGTAVNYLFNENFWKTLNLYERAFIFAHETLHVFLNHGIRGLAAIDDVNDQRLVNIAMDVVINESLITDFKFDRSLMPLLSKKLCFFDNIFQNTNYFNPPLNDSHRGKFFEYYYNLLKNKLSDNTSGSNGDFADMIVLGDSIGSKCNKEDIDTLKDMIKDTVGAKMSREEQTELQNIIKSSATLGTVAGSVDGTGFIDYSYIKVKKVLTWKQLIKKITKFSSAFKDIERWMPKNRRVYHIQNELLLPSIIEDENPDRIKPQLFVFLDTSGSCYDVSEQFYKALKSIPLEHFIVRSFGFSTSVYEIFNGKLRGFGGTSFNIIENKIQNIIKTENVRYPDLVFIITDGHGDKVTPEYPKRWYWFLTPYSSRCYISSQSKVFKLSEFYNDRQ